MNDNGEIEYSEDFICRLELAFGEGFLSPGGQEEVAKIVEGINLKNKIVLDIGTGIGGPACLLIEEHGAEKVIGIDVEEPVLRIAAKTVANRGLQDQVILQKVDPGPLPFDDNSFDIVFSKDSIIHIPDKLALFKEVYRTTRPGGWVIMSDWYCSEKPFTEEMKQWLKTIGLSFAMTPIQHDGSFMQQAGFIDCKTLDRNQWFTKLSKDVVTRLKGPYYEKMVAALGEEGAQDWISRAQMRAVISEQGQLRPGHLRGRKPG